MIPLRLSEPLPGNPGFLLTSRKPSARLVPSTRQGRKRGRVHPDRRIPVGRHRRSDQSREQRAGSDDVPKPTSVIIVRDRDRPGTYASILRFNSYEEAMRHSESDATHERVAKLGPLMKGDVRFYNLDILDETIP